MTIKILSLCAIALCLVSCKNTSFGNRAVKERPAVTIEEAITGGNAEYGQYRDLTDEEAALFYSVMGDSLYVPVKIRKQLDDTTMVRYMCDFKDSTELGQIELTLDLLNPKKPKCVHEETFLDIL